MNKSEKVHSSITFFATINGVAVAQSVNLRESIWEMLGDFA
jgi:hypothetical protein